MKIGRRMMACGLVLALLCTAHVPQTATAAKKVKLNKKSASLKVGKSLKLKVKNTKKKVKWTVKSGKKYITLKNKKKTSVTVKAKKAGTAKVQAKVGKKKLVCKVKVTKSGSQSGGTSSKSSKSTTKVTGTPGRNITLPTGAEVFQIGTRKLALGISLSDVQTILGSLSSDSKRIEKSPQGFTAITFNPSKSYENYMIIYLKNNVVVGICGIGRTMSYADVSAGTNGNLLPGSWSIETEHYKTSLGTAGAYYKTVGNAKVLAYVNALGDDNSVYCIQAFNKSLDMDDMAYPTPNNAYDASALAAMKLEIGDLINAYRVFYGIKPCYVNDLLAGCAQAYCDTQTGSKCTNRSYDEVGPVLLDSGVDYLSCGEASFYGCGDAIGFANSMIEEQNTYSVMADQLSFHINYIGLGVSARACADGSYYTYLIMDYCDEL